MLNRKSDVQVGKWYQYARWNTKVLVVDLLDELSDNIIVRFQYEEMLTEIPFYELLKEVI